MNFAYTLCEQPAVGLVFWALSMCTRVPLAGPAPLALTIPDAQITLPFTVPVARKYPLDVQFIFPKEARAALQAIVGRTYGSDCLQPLETVPAERRAALGRPIPFRVIVRDAATGLALRADTVVSKCITAHGPTTMTRQITMLDLKPGNYLLTVINQEAQPGLEQARTVILLEG